MSAGFVSLMYHNVVADDAAIARAQAAGLSPSITGYFVSAAQFAEHLDAMARRADVMTAADVAAFYQSAHSSPTAARPRVQITFDDGWRDSVDIAGPLLAARGLQAMLFVTTGLIGRPQFLTRSELGRLPAGTFCVGSHTVTHPFLNELGDADIESELHRSRAELEEILGQAVDAVSIPNGAADDRVIRIAADCGYRFVYLSAVHRNTRGRGALSIGRAAIRVTTTAATVARYAGGDLRREQVRAALLSLPKQILGRVRYRRIRSALLGARCEAQEMFDLLHTRPRAAPVELSVIGRRPSEHGPTSVSEVPS